MLTKPDLTSSRRSAPTVMFNEKIELKKYSREEYDSMSMAQHQQLCKLQKKAVLIKGKKTSESNRALEARVVMLEAKTDNISDES